MRQLAILPHHRTSRFNPFFVFDLQYPLYILYARLNLICCIYIYYLMYTFIDWFIYVHVYEHFCSVTSMPPIFTSRCGDAYQPRLLWSPDFPLIQEGIPLLPSLLDEADMQLSYHLFHTLGLRLGETNCCSLSTCQANGATCRNQTHKTRGADDART